MARQETQSACCSTGTVASPDPATRPRELEFFLSGLGVPADAVETVLAGVKAGVSCIEGIVESITRQRDGSVQVCIGSDAFGKVPKKPEDLTLRNYFYKNGVDDFEEADLEELKRAQNNRLCVKVCFDKNRRIVQLTVFVCKHPFS